MKIFIRALTVVLFLFWCIVFEVPIYALVMSGIGIVVFLIGIGIWSFKAQKKLVSNIQKAEFVKEIPVYKPTEKNTGYSIGWNGRRENYVYTRTIDHYECVFSVIYKDGKREMINCKKGSDLCNELIFKVLKLT